MAKDITRFGGNYVTTRTLLSFPNTAYNYAILDLAGLNTQAIDALGISTTATIGVAFIYADPNITVPCISYNNVSVYGLATVVGLSNITLVNANYPDESHLLSGNYNPADLNGLGYVNNVVVGAASIGPGPVTIDALSYVNAPTIGVASVIQDPVLAIGYENTITIGLPIFVSYLPPKEIAVTASNGLDIKLINIAEQAAGLAEIVGYYDVDFDEQGDFQLEQGMRTNLIMSLFCERRAAPYEIALPSMRRGWWGNINSPTSGFEIGSKLWLLEQNRLTVATVNLAQQWSQQGLQWLVDDGLAAKVVVTASAQNLTAVPGVAINVAITTDANTVEYKWYTTWSNTQ